MALTSSVSRAYIQKAVLAALESLGAATLPSDLG
jgi:hypothetical protein